MRAPAHGARGWFAVVATAVALLASACAFEAGEPWGHLDVTLHAAFTPAERLDDDGRLRTSLDYAVAIDAVELAVAGVIVRLGQEIASGTFDPAAPPPGYTLCHNGHCHRDDGALVPYEAIAAELAGGAGAAETAAAIAAAADGPANIWQQETPVALRPCGDACLLERGVARRLEVAVDAIRLTGRVFDRRSGDARRLPLEGIALHVDLIGDLRVQAPLSVRIDRDEGASVPLHRTLTLTGGLLDGLDFAAADVTATVPERFEVTDAQNLPLAARLRANLPAVGGSWALVARCDPGARDITCP